MSAAPKTPAGVAAAVVAEIVTDAMSYNNEAIFEDARYHKVIAALRRARPNGRKGWKDFLSDQKLSALRDRVRAALPDDDAFSRIEDHYMAELMFREEAAYLVGLQLGRCLAVADRRAAEETGGQP